MDCIVKLNLAQCARQTVEVTVGRLNSHVDTLNQSICNLDQEVKSKQKSIYRNNNLIKTFQNELILKETQL